MPPKSAAAKQTSTAVDKLKTTALAKPLGGGFEEADADSFAIPFFSILQSNSPAVEEGLVKGAKPGLIINTVTNELFESITVIPVAYQRRFIRWGGNRGGFKGQFNVEQAKGLEAKGEVVPFENRLFYPLPDGSVHEKKCDLLADTRVHFVVRVREDGTTEPGLVSMSSSNIKKSKGWMTRMQMRGGDMWGHAYVLGTKDESNDEGNWKGWKVDNSEDVKAEQFENDAVSFRGAVVSGTANVKMDQARD
jgi:hypothetical protein